VPRILIAEDNDAQREGLRALLERAGFEVTAAPDGAEALEKLRASAFDLLLVDVWMPRMNGLEVLGHLREQASPPRVIADARPPNGARSGRSPDCSMTGTTDGWRTQEEYSEAKSTVGSSGDARHRGAPLTERRSARPRVARRRAPTGARSGAIHRPG